MAKPKVVLFFVFTLLFQWHFNDIPWECNDIPMRIEVIFDQMWYKNVMSHHHRKFCLGEVGSPDGDESWRISSSWTRGCARLHWLLCGSNCWPSHHILIISWLDTVWACRKSVQGQRSMVLFLLFLLDPPLSWHFLHVLIWFITSFLIFSHSYR